MELYPKNKIPISEVRKFLIIFYIVGLVGFIIPFSKPFFITITPYALLLNVYLLAIYHAKYTLKYVLIFLIIFISGYSIEVVGVKTGLIFGSYIYGNALGIKLFETPLLIGVNWLFLSYTAIGIAEKLRIKKWLTLFVAPALMLVYDIVMEQVAPKMDMWNWQNSEVPIRNYVAWYVIAFSFVLLLKAFKIKTSNPLSAILFICQFLFFTALTFLL
ncbi:putative membrane protein [Balneicella halophila]|uniref:Putative membrane protein n=1 Tax=Balneicella halophila TaxID=1537566 RepID=A0A7L4UM62_BALHA|nr:carotenoid biosynthesis protein [Balneicella halophila]PVX49217.1 putative membrane protein [Balneicella halophila]